MKPTFGNPIRAALFLFVLFVAPERSSAQPTAPVDVAVPPAQVVQPPQVVPLPGLVSPREALRTFLRAMKAGDTDGAIACLDLSYLTTETIAISGPTVAHQLRETINRMVGISLSDSEHVWQQIPGDNTDSQSYRLSEIDGAKRAANNLVLQRGDDANWRFTQATCKAVETQFSETEKLPDMVHEETSEEELKQTPFPIRLRQWFPLSLRQTHFILPDFQWICLLALIFVGLAADVLARKLLTWGSLRWFMQPEEGGDADADAKATEKMWRPLGRLVNAGTWYFGTKLIGLSSVVLKFLLIALKLFTIFAAMWTAFAAIDLAAKHMMRRAKRSATKFDDLLVPLVSKSLKLFVACAGMLSAAQTFDLPVLGLMGGLGIGGAALAFASKDAVSNFFGSITVLFDRPFEVGDWIVTDGAEGTVEAVGFRSTRIRTFYNSLVTLPNSLLTTSVVDNMGRRRYRRIKTTIGVQYDTTPEQIDAMCEGIRELIRLHPYTRKDYYHVYLNNFGPSSLDIMLYCFVECPDWAIELRERHRLLADIMRLAAKLKVQFAFPTQTVHLFSERASGEVVRPEQPLALGQEMAADIADRLPDEIPGHVEF